MDWSGHSACTAYSLWPASWLPAVDKSRGSKSVEVQRVWEVYDERLQFMSRHDAMQLDESLDAGDVSRSVWSGAVESALADAYQFSGGPLPGRGLVLGRESASFRVVTFGGHKVRKARGNAADAVDAADVFLYRDSSIAPLHDMRRRFKAVMDVLDAMTRYGISLSRSVELTAQWDRILAIGPLYPVTLDDLSVVRGVGVGEFHRIVSDVHRCLSNFIHAIVVHRRDEAIRVWRNWIRADPMVHPFWWLLPDLVPPAPFLQCEPRLTPGGSGVLSDPARIDEEFRNAWLPYFCRCGQRETGLEEFAREVDGWLPLLSEVHLTRLTGQMLAYVVQRKSATAGSLDVWGWRELKVLPVAWYDELARILAKVEDFGVWPDGLLDAYTAMIPKTDGDATHLGERPLCVLLVIHRVWTSARMGHLDDWFRSWVPDSVFSAGVVAVLLRLGTLLLLILRRFLLVPLILISIYLLLMSSSLLIPLIGRSWIVSKEVLACLDRFVMLILNTMLMLGYDLSWPLALVSLGLGMGYSSGVPFEHDVHCCFVSALVSLFVCSGGDSASVAC